MKIEVDVSSDNAPHEIIMAFFNQWKPTRGGSDLDWGNGEHAFSGHGWSRSGDENVPLAVLFTEYGFRVAEGRPFQFEYTFTGPFVKSKSKKSKKFT